MASSAMWIKPVPMRSAHIIDHFFSIGKRPKVKRSVSRGHPAISSDGMFSGINSDARANSSPRVMSRHMSTIASCSGGHSVPTIPGYERMLLTDLPRS